MLGMTQPEKWPRLETFETGRWENNLASHRQCGSCLMAAKFPEGFEKDCGVRVGMRMLEREHG